MTKHDLHYKIYKKNYSYPYIEIHVVPHINDEELLSAGIINISYKKDKSILDKIIDDINKTIEGKKHNYIFGEEWCIYTGDKYECDFWCIDNNLCTISTIELYNMLLEWRVYFRENFDESMEGLCE